MAELKSPTRYSCLQGVVSLALLLSLSMSLAYSQSQNSHSWWSAAVERALKASGANRPQMELALKTSPVSQHDGLQFLLENMPDVDLKALSASFLLENLDIAYKGMERSPWKDEISKALFLNDVLPYACLNEKRDDSRRFLRDKTEALVAGCKTPGEAARVINQKLFPLLNARYSTERKRPDQSPLETVESGKATCSGLSILLVDACRTVGIPARVAGTPMWTNMRGNHTWVEVWDNGWHYVGAAEPDPNGLDHAWFAGDAAKAQRDAPQHAIYASSFRKTSVSFPLVWAPEITWVSAENVTDRYAAPAVHPVIDASKSHILVRVLDADGKRVAAPVTLKTAGETEQTGVSKGESADLNNMLTFDIFRTCPPRKYELSTRVNGKAVTGVAMLGVDAEQTVTLQLASTSEAALTNLLNDVFGLDAVKFAAATAKLTSVKPTDAARKLAWAAYRASAGNEELRKQFADKIVQTSDRTSPYLWRHVGVKPANGWALVIAMHGGGGAPKEVNDREWQYMFSTYYKEHPEAGGYVYLALRAPNDAWNGFYDDAISPLVEKLIKQFVLFDDVDPDRVYVMGASHGGYGAYVIGPKIPYRFAAIHAAASAATDGETMGENLRNVRFTSTVGENDTAYGRIERGRKFQAQMNSWRTQFGGYPADFQFPSGVGHLVPDHDKLSEMLKYSRDAWPRHIVWTQSDSVLNRNYWIQTGTPKPGRHIDATVDGNTIMITAVNQPSVTIWLDQSLVDLDKPIILIFNGKTSKMRLKPNLATYCAGLRDTADPHLAAPVRLAAGGSE